MSLRDLSTHLEQVGHTLTGASARMSELAPPAEAFGAHVPGALGELGQALHGLAVAAFAARSREAAAHGARLSDTASTLQLVGAAYADVDEAVRRRHGGGQS